MTIYIVIQDDTTGTFALTVHLYHSSEILQTFLNTKRIAQHSRYSLKYMLYTAT